MSKDEKESQDSNYGMTDRRRRERILDGVSASSGIGSVGVGIFILNMLVSQGDTQKDHGRWIHENTRSNERVLEMLQEMNEEFRSDIRRFEDEHVKLQSGLRDLELGGATTGTRLQSLEQIVLNPKFSRGDWSPKEDAEAMKDFEVDIKTWVGDHFEKKGGQK
jgi:hypothetical protein